MTTTEDDSSGSLEQALSDAVAAGIDRVVEDTAGGSAGARKSYDALKAPILAKLGQMENDQQFEIRFGSAEAAEAFATGFNERAPRTPETIYGAFAEENVLSLKRMAPIGVIVRDGKVVPL